MDALVLASAASTGWRSDAYKIVILITDSTFWDGQTVYNSKEDAKAALVASNIVPVFLTTTSPASTYNSLVNTLGFGIATTVQSDYSNVFTTSYSQILAALKVLSVTVAQDTYGIVTSVGTARQTVNLPSSVVSSIQIKYPSTNLDSIENYPEIGITMMGWGSSTIVAQGNILFLV